MAKERETQSPFRLFRRNRQEQILSQYSLREQSEIRNRQQILSSLASFIGKDFRIPVELSDPGTGWQWDSKKNKILIDTKDLLEKPMDYLRCVISHEGGHRRISRIDVAPEEIRKQPGFSFLMDAVEDARTNNFLIEAYPRFAKQMDSVYGKDLDFEGKVRAEASMKLGHLPRFVQAGLELIKQSYKESKGENPGELSPDLTPEVRNFVKKTLNSARDSWLRYPSREEANKSENLIRRYARASYKIIKDEIYPQFKTLVDMDIADQKAQQLLENMKADQGQSGGQSELPQELTDGLDEEEKEELENAVGKKQKEENEEDSQDEGDEEDREREQEEKGTDSGSESDEENSHPDFGSLSESLQEKMRDYLNSLPEEEQEELGEESQKALQDFEEMLSEELKGKLPPPPDKRSNKDKTWEDWPLWGEERISEEEMEENRRRFQEFINQALAPGSDDYEKYRSEVLPLIDSLEADLRGIFVERRERGWQNGFKVGKKIDIKRRMQEKALDIPAVESKAWQRRKIPQEKDYAISLLVDLSGSMQGEKINETFKGAIVLAEVLNRLSINTEILGFNTYLYEYQTFGQYMGEAVRKHMINMLRQPWGGVELIIPIKAGRFSKLQGGLRSKRNPKNF
jgi:hypothetical protein